MVSSEKNSWLVPVVFVTVLTFIFTAMYITSNGFNKPQQLKSGKEFDYAGRPTQPLTTTPGQIVLSLNEKQIVGRNGLVFKGVEKKIILVDLYILEMDPEEGFRKRFTKKEGKKGVVMGEGKYRLLSVNSRHLVLRRVDK